MRQHIPAGLIVVSVSLASCALQSDALESDAPEDGDVAEATQALTQTHTAVAVAVGMGHSCALLDNARVKCWGGNWTGQLGLGDAAGRGDSAGEMGQSLPYVALGYDRYAKAITVGEEHSCALLDDGHVKCWGDNSYGQLGLGDALSRGAQPGQMGDSLPAVDLGTGRTAIAIEAGGLHTCALLDNNQVKCWGNNVYGQLGIGSNTNRGDGPGEMGDALPTVSLGTGRTAKSLIGGWGHTCALLDNNQIKCWGGSGYGQLGQGSQSARGDGPNEMGDTLATINLGIGRSAKSLAAGYLHTCAVLDNNGVKCWGGNGYGQLGLGDVASRGDSSGEMGDSLPYVALGTGRTAKSVVAGEYHTCATLDNNQVKCWGKNGYGELGLGDVVSRGDNAGEMGDSLPYVNLGTGVTAKAIAGGNYHTCAILNTSAVKCWGQGWYGTLGLGDTSSRGDAAGEMSNSLPTVDLGYGPLASKFFKSDPRAIRVMEGTPFNVNDPSWLVNGSDQNQSLFAYKILSAFYMLGYNTMVGHQVGFTDPHLRVLHKLQQQYGFPVEDLLQANVLSKMDDLLVVREASQAIAAQQFVMSGHLWPAGPNGVSTDSVATNFSVVDAALPAAIRANLNETLYCHSFQCYGNPLYDALGNPLGSPVNPQNYFFHLPYHASEQSYTWMPPAAVDVGTALHEYAHYLDNTTEGSGNPTYPLFRSIHSRTFNAISYNVPNSGSYGCVTRKSNDQMDYITPYGFLSAYACPQGTYVAFEEFAECFSVYVAAGKNFRAAALTNAMIAAKYAWLKTNVFGGVEYNTDLPRNWESGCNDAPGTAGRLPGYTSCNEDYIWNGTLPTL